MNNHTGVSPIDPVELAEGRVLYAPAVRAGSWVFATGHMAQAYGAGMAADVTRSRAPNGQGSKRMREATRIFRNLSDVLGNADSGLHRLVRTDQYYTSVAMVPPFQAERRRRLGQDIPPSTSIVQQGLLLPGAELEIQAIALANDGPDIQHLDNTALRARATSGYSPALTAGDLVFVPGCTAMAQGDEPRRQGVATAALIEEGLQWGGEPLRRETEFIVNERLIPSLALAEVSQEDVVKAQIYLTEPRDCAVVADVWHTAFENAALSIIPCAERGLAPVGGKIEINVIAARKQAETIDAAIATPFINQTQAVRTGDLLFLSALLAIDEDGLSSRAMVDPRQPHFIDRAEAEAEVILAAAARLCNAAGTHLSQVVRAQHFLTDISSFPGVYRAWQRHLPGQAIPFSVIEVPSPLPVPEAAVMMDLWVHAPE